MFFVTSTLGIFWQHLNHPNLCVHSVYRFHVHFPVRLILHELGIFLPHEDGFPARLKSLTLRVATTVSVMTTE